MYTRFARILSVCALLALLPLPAPADRLPALTSPAFLAAAYPIQITPDQLQISGHAASLANCADPGVCAWLNNLPPGSLMLGVNPASRLPADWDGGSASVQLELPDLYQPTRLLLKIAWPDQDGAGLRSPAKNRVGRILLDGALVWDKRTSDLLRPGWFFAGAGNEFITTLRVSGSQVHTLTFQVGPQTAWDLSQIEISAYAPIAEYRGIGYSPYRDCQWPGGTQVPDASQIQSDLTRLSHTTNAIRTYSAVGVNALVPALAIQAGLAVFPGAWLDYPKTTLEQDSAEIQGLVSLACSNPVDGVIVGNEYYLRHRTPEAIAYLVQRVGEVKAGLAACGKSATPVTTAEIDNMAFTWANDAATTPLGLSPAYQPVLDSLDFFMIHIYPFWSGLPIEGAADFTAQRFLSTQAALQSAYPGQDKWQLIGETGWPSGGEPNGGAVPSMANQLTYLRELLPLTDQHQIDLLYFDAFDELWKYDEGGKPGTHQGYGAGQRWGYAYSDRSAKHDFYGVSLPSERLPALAQRLPEQVFIPALERPADPVQAKTFTLYSEWPEGADNFVPSGYMGDLADIAMSGCDRADPHGGEMAYRVDYAASGAQGWAGVYWQYPENNWGDKPGALDLSRANQLTFWAKGATGDEVVRFFAGGIGSSSTAYQDTLRPEATSGFVRLTAAWHKYTINLAGRDLSGLIGGFGWTADRCANPAGATFWLDDIRYEYLPGLQPAPDHSGTFNIYSDASAPGNHYFPTGMMGDAASPAVFNLNECWTDNPHSGKHALRAQYTGGYNLWAGVYWLQPAWNWGDRPGGYNLTGLTQLSLWARSDNPLTPVEIIAGGVGYRADYRGSTLCSQPIQPFPDSLCPKLSAMIAPDGTWRKFSIPIPEGANLSALIGGFGFVVKYPITLYIDDVLYESP